MNDLLINPSYKSTNPKNLVKIGPVHSAEIVWLEVGPLKSLGHDI